MAGEFSSRAQGRRACYVFVIVSPRQGCCLEEHGICCGCPGISQFVTRRFPTGALDEEALLYQNNVQTNDEACPVRRRTGSSEATNAKSSIRTAPLVSSDPPLTRQGAAENFSALAGLYDRYFAVVPATTPALLDAALALRYQVYCVEHEFLERSQQIAERERDEYDDHSVHAVLIHNPTDQVVGCVRLVLPPADGGVLSLPLRTLLNPEQQARLDQCDSARTAEISRYAVSKAFRRRQGEEFFPDMGDLPGNDVRRLVPHMSLGLLRGVGRLAAEHHIETLCAAMAPALLRLLDRFGLTFHMLGPAIEYHGLRQPCIADCEGLLAGMAGKHSEYHELVDAAYHGRPSEPS